MCHFEKGEKNEVIFILSCPGKEEEKAGKPAAGQTGINLDVILNSLNTKFNYDMFDRRNITITNSTTRVEYIDKTNRTEATKKEVLDQKNLERLSKEINGVSRYIICCGVNAELAIEELNKKQFITEARILKISHLGNQALNKTIKKNIDGKKYAPTIIVLNYLKVKIVL